jgi:MFS family permease
MVSVSLPPPAPGRASHVVRALRHRNFRLFFAGQSLSLVGTWMTKLATTWLVYRLTGSSFLVGVVAFAGLFPTFALAPLAGVWMDRIDRRSLLVWTQAAAAVQSLLMAAFTLAGIITIGQIVLLAVMQGVINAFDMPARQSFLVEMVEGRDDLGNAIALNSSMVNGARLVGPAIAGLLIGIIGEGGCFLIDGLSYLAVIASLVLMRVTPRETRGAAASMLEQTREGWRYVTTFRPVRSILVLAALLCFLGYPYTVVLPVFASQVFGGGGPTFGLLTGAAGLGAFVSAVSLAARTTVVGLTRNLQAAAAMVGGGLVLFGLSHTLWLSLLLMAVVGFGIMQTLAVSNTIIQTLVTDDKRGRVMSYYTMAVAGASPIGSLAIGALASRVGAPLTMVAAGLLCLVASVWFTSELPKVRAVMRPIYRDLGLLPVREID